MATIIVGLTVNGTPGSRDDIIFPIRVPGGPEIELPVITVRATWDSTPAQSQWVLAYKPFGSQAQLTPDGPIPAKPDRATFTMDVPGSYRVVNVVDGGTEPPQIASVIAASRIIMQPFSQWDPPYWNSLRIPAFAETTEFDKQPLSSQPNSCGWAREMEAWFFRIMRYGFGCVVWDIAAQTYTKPAYNLRFFSDDTIDEVTTEYWPLTGTADIRIPKGAGAVSVWDGSTFTGPIENLRVTVDGNEGTLTYDSGSKTGWLQLSSSGGGGGGVGFNLWYPTSSTYRKADYVRFLAGDWSTDAEVEDLGSNHYNVHIPTNWFTPVKVSEGYTLSDGDFAYTDSGSDITVYLP
jgi:hypothetical protein